MPTTTITQPTEESIQHAIDLLAGSIFDEIADDLQIARRMYRVHPELVTCELWPEPLRSCAIQYSETGDDPEDDGGSTVGYDKALELANDPNLRETLLPKATQLAKGWLELEQSQAV